MKVHVTGATGFVGTHFMDDARRSGHDMVGLVRTRTPEIPEAGQLEIGDIAEVRDWSRAVQGADAVVHLAARVHVMRDNSSDAATTYEHYNTVPTIQLARAAASAGVARFIFVSSIKVNGERTTGVPFTSSSSPAPVDAYGASKLKAEVELRKVATETGMDVVILRPAVVYGPGVGGNIRRIASAVARGLPLPFGGIANQRTMLSVDNLVAALSAAITTPAPPSEAVLVGDIESVSTRQLVELLAEGFGRRPRLVSVPASILRLGASALNRRQDADRLLEDLVVEPNWDRLGLESSWLTGPATALPALGQWFAENREER